MLSKPLCELDIEDRIKLFDDQYRRFTESKEYFNAFISLRDGGEIFEEILSRDGPLKGFIVPVKDNIAVKGMLNTCASKILSNYISPYDAHVISILKSRGGVVVGKTNMDEFAMGNSGETSFYGPTLNPWDTDRVPGGSSSGSAVAVAWDGFVSLGSDTGGSVRLPAAYTHVLGLKPTYGTLSRFGLVSYADSLEQIGIFTRFSRDMAYLLYHLMEYDPRDMTMFYGGKRDEVRERLRNIYGGSIEDKKVTIVYSSDIIGYCDEPIREAVFKALDRLGSLGVELVDVDLGFVKPSLSIYYIIAMVEASSNLARYSGENYGIRVDGGSYWDMVALTRSRGFGAEVKRRIVMGTFASSKGYEGRYYVRALRGRRWLKERLNRILRDNDFILLPVSPRLPPRLGEAVGPKGYIIDIFTVIPNLTGNPALAIPIGLVDGLPTGIQLVGRYYSDPDLIRMAFLMEDVIYNPRLSPVGGD